MDPLSIIAASVSFVDIARRIKDSVDKVGQTRQKLHQLVENLVEELAELQKLCQGRLGRLDYADLDSTHSLQKLHSELMNTLEYCLKLAERRPGNKGLSSVRYHFIAWVKDAEMEAHILRLRDRVSSVHRRFTIISSLRVEQTENRLLVASLEHSVILKRLDSAMSQLLIKSHANGAYPASLLDKATRDGIEYQYLHRQVQETIALLRTILPHTFTIEETRGPLSFECRHGQSTPSRTSLMRSTTIEALETLQLLELDPASLALWEGSSHLMGLGLYLEDLRLGDDAVAIYIGITNIYQTLMQRDPGTYLPSAVWGLQRLSHIQFGTREGLDTAKQAVDICRGAAAMLREDYSLYLAHSLSIYSHRLAASRHFDEALAYAVEALAMQRKAPIAQQDPGCFLVCWEASGEENIALTSARTISRPYDTALNDMSSLGIYARILRSLGRWSEALIITTEVIHCLEALVKWDTNMTRYLSHQLIRWHKIHRNLMARTCPPRPPLAVTISKADDPAELDNKDPSGQGGYEAQSAALVRQ